MAHRQVRGRQSRRPADAAGSGYQHRRNLLADRQAGGTAGAVHGRSGRGLLLRSRRQDAAARQGDLLAALGYFVLPANSIPDIIVGLGFTDDVAVLTAAISAVRAHMTPAHRLAAKQALAGQR